MIVMIDGMKFSMHSGYINITAAVADVKILCCTTAVVIVNILTFK